MRFSESELERAAIVGKELGLHLPAAQVAAILRRGATDAPEDTPTNLVKENDDALAEFQTDEPDAPENFAGQNFAGKIRAVSLSRVEETEKHSLSLSLKSDRKAALKIQINRLANSLARQLDIDYGEVHRFWKRQLNGAGQAESTEEDLQNKFFWLNRCLDKKSLSLFSGKTFNP